MKARKAPLRWSMMHRVQHPPLMMKQLVQGVCGGIRWLQVKELAEFIAKKALADGFPSTKAMRNAFGAGTTKLQRCRKAAAPPQLSRNANELCHPPSFLTTTSTAIAPLTKVKRLVSYDVLDCTLGGGYHAGAILENGKPYTRVVALDCDADALFSAKELVSTFGGDRFRFIHTRMSEARSMFGERSFDAIMIDSGPSFTQLEDPERGFLLNEEDDHGLDMRYGLSSGMSALEYLNTVPQHALAGALASYRLLTPQQAMKMSRCIRKSRPFCGSRRLLEVVEMEGNDLPEDGWMTQASYRKSSMSWKFLTSLRCIVNNELYELREALQQALLLLRDGGRLVVLSRLRWEEELIKKAIEDHPQALLSYTEDIDVDNVQDHGHTRHTKLWVATRVKQSSFVLKNAHTLTNENVRESSARWMNGMFAGQTHGFPAHNFTFENDDFREKNVRQKNTKPPPFDVDDDN